MFPDVSQAFQQAAKRVLSSPVLANVPKPQNTTRDGSVTMDAWAAGGNTTDVLNAPKNATASDKDDQQMLAATPAGGASEAGSPEPAQSAAVTPACSNAGVMAVLAMGLWGPSVHCAGARMQAGCKRAANGACAPATRLALLQVPHLSPRCEYLQIGLQSCYLQVLLVCNH
jgi:hypothetical protein